VAAGYQAYTGRGGGGGGGLPTAGGRAADSPPAASERAAPPTEDEVRAAEVALGRALHALHRTAGAPLGRLTDWRHCSINACGHVNTVCRRTDPSAGCKSHRTTEHNSNTSEVQRFAALLMLWRHTS
jgi:hypothetical protein